MWEAIKTLAAMALLAVIIVILCFGASNLYHMLIPIVGELAAMLASSLVVSLGMGVLLIISKK